MKRFLIFMCVCFSFMILYAQRYNSSNSINRVAIVQFEQGNDGFYLRSDDVDLLEVKFDDIVNIYAFDSKKKIMYVETNNSNIMIFVTDDHAKQLKKNSNIPQLTGNALDIAVQRVTDKIIEKFEEKNKENQYSIFIADSIEKVNKHKYEIELEDYKKTHIWNVLQINNPIKCEICGNYDSNEIHCLKIYNDTIYWLGIKEGYFDISYPVIHASKLSSLTKNDKLFMMHFDAFSDSLSNSLPDLSIPTAILINNNYLIQYYEKLKEEAPYGFFEDWNWGHKYDVVTFDFVYHNTNNKAIKYINVFWSLSNSVGDLRKTGNFIGTGPVPEGETGSWKFDRSDYYVGGSAGDVSKMTITKVTITYMDGSSKTLLGDMIKIK